MTNTYDAMERLATVSNTVSDASVANVNCYSGPVWASSKGLLTWAQNASYNAAGQLTNLSMLGSVTEGGNNPCVITPMYFNRGWQYNALNQMTEVDTGPQMSPGAPSLYSTVPTALATVFFTKYHFSGSANNGQVSQVDDARLGYSVTYGYDALNRLTQATALSPGAWSQAIQYDGFGNITTKQTPGGSEAPMPEVNSANNQLLGVTYDANGNATAFNAFTLTYDMESRMVGAQSGTAVEAIAYDPANHRVQSSGNVSSPDTLLYWTGWGREGRLIRTGRTSVRRRVIVTRSITGST